MEKITRPTCGNQALRNDDECPFCGENLRAFRPAPKDNRPWPLRLADLTPSAENDGRMAVFARQYAGRRAAIIRALHAFHAARSHTRRPALWRHTARGSCRW